MAFNLTGSGLKCGSELAVKFVPGNATTSDQLTFYWGTNKITWDTISTSNATVTSSTKSSASYTKSDGDSYETIYTLTNVPVYQVPSMSIGEKRIVRIGVGINTKIFNKDVLQCGSAIKLPSTGQYFIYYAEDVVDSYKKADEITTYSSLNFKPFPTRKLSAGGSTSSFYYESKVSMSTYTPPNTLHYCTYFIQRYA